MMFNVDFTIISNIERGMIPVAIAISTSQKEICQANH